MSAGRRAYQAYEKTQGRDGEDWKERTKEEQVRWEMAAYNTWVENDAKKAFTEFVKTEHPTLSMEEIEMVWNKREWKDRRYWEEAIQGRGIRAGEYTSSRHNGTGRMELGKPRVEADWKKIIKWTIAATTLSALIRYDIGFGIDFNGWGISLHGLEHRESREVIRIATAIVTAQTARLIFIDALYGEECEGMRQFCTGKRKKLTKDWKNTFGGWAIRTSAVMGVLIWIVSTILKGHG